MRSSSESARGDIPGEHALPRFAGLRILARVGEGGMGTVFRAVQEDLDRLVAVKTLRADLARGQELREQFVREARILARLEHPGIVSVHYTGEEDGVPYYVMRLVEGATVDAALAGAGAAEVAATFRDVARALATAHAAGVLHRDVKPANILVNAEGRATLVDFGLALQRAVGPEPASEEELAGTLDHQAPELIAGERASVASDVYALGVTLYRVLTGRVPFSAESLDEKLRAIRAEDPQPPRALVPDVPKPLQAICLRAMERAPADRYASAEELARDLERFLAGEPVTALPVRTRSLLRRRIERHLFAHEEWVELGLLEERQRADLQQAYERLDEEQRGLLRGALRSLPALLLLCGILVAVLGPAILQVVAWDRASTAARIAIPGAAALLLGVLGHRRWIAVDRRRAVACFLGAALLVPSIAFALLDLVPALRLVLDDEGNAHSVRLGTLWLPPGDAPAWMHSGARRLELKLLLAAAAAWMVAAGLHRRTRSAAFLWIVGLATLGAAIPGALLLGWRDLPEPARWALAIGAALGVLLAGVPLDRRWRRDRARPFYGLGVVVLALVVVVYAGEGQPLRAFGVGAEIDEEAWSFALHGLGVVALGLLAHRRGPSLARQGAGVVLLLGLLFTLGGLAELSSSGRIHHELIYVGACVAFLVLGIATHRNALVVPASIPLPLAVGTVSQRHLDALWAWAGATILAGALLVVLGMRMGARAESERSGARASEDARAREQDV